MGWDLRLAPVWWAGRVAIKLEQKLKPPAQAVRTAKLTLARAEPERSVSHFQSRRQRRAECAGAGAVATWPACHPPTPQPASATGGLLPPAPARGYDPSLPSGDPRPPLRRASPPPGAPALQAHTAPSCPRAGPHCLWVWFPYAPQPPHWVLPGRVMEKGELQLGKGLGSGQEGSSCVGQPVGLGCRGGWRSGSPGLGMDGPPVDPGSCATC